MVANFLVKTLTTPISPMVYIMMFVSVFIGFCFGLNVFVGGSESILYNTGVLVHKQIWGAILFTTATLAEIGLITKNEALISLGGVTGFMAWLFACISLVMEAHWYVFVTVALFHLLFHGYVVLSGALGYLIREPAALVVVDRS